MKNYSKAKNISYMAMLLTLIVVLSIFESMLTAVMALPPGIKPGLANIVTMFALFFIGKKEAFLLTVAKGVFVLITRGFTSGVLSITGGILSILVIIIISAILKDKISYLLLSIAGAVFHNTGQLLALTLLLGNNKYTLYYLPVLIVSGIIMGVITGVLLKTLMPVLTYPLKELEK